MDRWNFIRQNRFANASGDLSRRDLPLLAIWGADNLNVDAQRNGATYRNLVPPDQLGTEVIIWPDATHGLLKSGPYNWQLATQWSWFAKARFIVEGRNAFAPRATDAIADWIGQISAGDSA